MAPYFNSLSPSMLPANNVAVCVIVKINESKLIHFPSQSGWDVFKGTISSQKQILSFNPCHAEYIKMPRPLLISSQSDYLIRVFDRNSHI